MQNLLIDQVPSDHLLIETRFWVLSSVCEIWSGKLGVCNDS